MLEALWDRKPCSSLKGLCWFELNLSNLISIFRSQLRELPLKHTINEILSFLAEFHRPIIPKAIHNTATD